MHSFHIMIYEFDKTVHEGDAVHCRIRTEFGSLGVKARHEPLLVVLKPGSSIEVRDLDGAVQEFAVTDGMLSFNENRCLVLLG